MLIRKKCSQENSGDENHTRKNDRGARPAIHKKQDERKREIKLVFDRERPSVRESGAAMEPDVLNREEKFPPRIYFWVFAPGRQKNVDRENDEICRHNAQRSPGEEAAKINRLAASASRTDSSRGERELRMCSR